MNGKLTLAWFTDETATLGAIREIRLRGYRVADVYTPYPVHGINEAMGLKQSRLPIACFVFGAFGTLSAFLFQSWVSTADWAVNIGGKPFFAWPSFIPITFEFTVLCAGLGSVAALFLVRRLFPWRKPRLALEGATDNRFVVAVEWGGASFDERALKNMLITRGAVDIREQDDVA